MKGSGVPHAGAFRLAPVRTCETDALLPGGSFAIESVQFRPALNGLLFASELGGRKPAENNRVTWPSG